MIIGFYVLEISEIRELRAWKSAFKMLQYHHMDKVTKSKQNKVGLSMKRCFQSEISVEMISICFLILEFYPV